MKKISSLIFCILILISAAEAQQAEVTIQLNEPFFDALLDALFKNPNPPSFPLAVNSSRFKIQSSRFKVEDLEPEIIRADSKFLYVNSAYSNPKSKIRNPKSNCDESIKLQREIDGVRTAVKFRDGKIYAPIAFSGNYNPPFVGCVEFSGWAESQIELNYDAEKRMLVGHATLDNVQLSGTNGVGSSFVTKLVQTAIDRKMNPIQILPLDKVSFVVPVQNAGSVRMKAVGMRPEITNNLLNVHIIYEFSGN